METETRKKTFTELINGETPVLVDFYTDWCAPCKMLTPSLKELKGIMGDDLHIIKIDAEKNADAAFRYQVRTVPALILFRVGRILWQQTGVMQTTQLKKIIDSKLQEEYEYE